MRLSALRYTFHGAIAMVILLMICVPVFAQDESKKPGEENKKAKERVHVEVPTIAPRPEDVATLDGIIKAFYEVICGPKNQPRQWARDRTLYIPGVRFVSTGKDKGKVHSYVLDHQTYVDVVNPQIFVSGFYEREIHRVTKTFGNITHIFSTYETRETPDGPITARGVNSIELFNDGNRWWIASAIWDDERPDNPIPKDLLP